MRRNLRPDEALELLKEQASSGKTLVEFAEEKGLKPKRLTWWRERLGPAALPSGKDPAAPSAKAEGPAFLQVQVRGIDEGTAAVRASGFEMVLQQGTTLRIPVDFDSRALARMVTALREVGAW